MRCNLTTLKSIMISLVLASCLMFVAGCAQIRLPAIDPTGNRIFLPAPNSTQLLTPGSITGTGVRSGCLDGSCLDRIRGRQTGFNTTLPATAPVAPALPVAPVPTTPAFQHPADPPPCVDGCQTRTKSKKHIIPDPRGVKTAGQLGEIVMSPSRIVAPVGSEIVALAGICGGDGFYVKNQPLEWLLSNDSVGQIIEVGGMHHSLFNKLVPPSSRKFDGQYAWGRTGLKNLVLSRGTPTPVDDIELVAGQTYVSLSSASPGTTYLTAVAPKAEAWDKRRATTIIHWVDGQWSIPTPSNATAGTVFPLTTLVNRSDGGQGVAGWTVRYQIVGGAPAEFAPTGSQTAEVVTGRDGQATAQIRQPAGKFDPGTTQVRVDVVRPAVYGEQELVVESSITTVTWTAPALTIRAIGPETAGIDEAFNYRIEVTNTGDQLARGVVVRTEDLDDGIEFISSSPKPTEYGRQYEWQLGDIAPGSSSRVIDIQLKSQRRGNVSICFEVASDQDRLRTETCAETEIAAPCIGLDIEGPTKTRVGEDVTFNFNVLNQCDEPLEDIELVVQYDTGLVASGIGNPIRFPISRLQFNENKVVPITFNVVEPGLRCFDLTITANGGHTSRARRCVDAVAAGGSFSDSNSPSPLRLELAGGNPMEVGGRSLVEMKVSNVGQTPLDSVTLINRFPKSMEAFELTPEFTYNWLGDELAINLGDFQPGQTKVCEVVYEGVQADGNIENQVSVTTATGASATDSIKMRVEPSGSAPGGRVPDQPFPPGAFQPPAGGQPSGPVLPEGPIGIPNDQAAQAAGEGTLKVDVQTIDRTIQMAQSDRPDASALQSSRIQFTVTNDRSTSDTNVDVTILVPPGIRMTDFNFDQGQLPIVGRNDDFTQFALQRRLEMRPGEQLTFVATVIGTQPGQGTFEVQAVSDSSPTPITGRDTVNILP